MKIMKYDKILRTKWTDSDTSAETLPQTVRQLALKERQLKMKRLYATMKVMKYDKIFFDCGNENFRQARINNFCVKCVVFARNRKFAKLTQ